MSVYFKNHRPRGRICSYVLRIITHEAHMFVDSTDPHPCGPLSSVSLISSHLIISSYLISSSYFISSSHLILRGCLSIDTLGGDDDTSHFSLNHCRYVTCHIPVPCVIHVCGLCAHVRSNDTDNTSDTSQTEIEAVLPVRQDTCCAVCLQAAHGNIRSTVPRDEAHDDT